MVVKQACKPFRLRAEFESSVISYGSQTRINLYRLSIVFESSVISYGSQTVKERNRNSN